MKEGNANVFRTHKLSKPPQVLCLLEAIRAEGFLHRPWTIDTIKNRAEKPPSASKDIKSSMSRGTAQHNDPSCRTTQQSRNLLKEAIRDGAAASSTISASVQLLHDTLSIMELAAGDMSAKVQRGQ